jgi:transposase-like protein
MAKSKTSKRYTPEFRRQMVELHRAGRGIPELSREFGPTPLDDRAMGQASQA